MPPPLVSEIHAVLRDHLRDLYAFYGLATGVKIARKHIGWYTKGLAGAAQFRFAMNQINDAETQLAITDQFFTLQASAAPRLRYADLPEELAA